MQKVKLEEKLFFDNNDFQMIENDEEFIFTSRKKFKWFKTSRTGYDILNILDSNHTIQDVINKISTEHELDSTIIENDIIKFCSQLIKETLITVNDETFLDNSSTILKSVYIDITNACNLKCYYCNKANKYNKNEVDFMCIDDFKRILDKIILINPNNLPVLYITGGEPLMHPSIEEILYYAHKKEFEILLWTNGTLISEKNIHKLKMYCNSIIVSIDGSNSLKNDCIRGDGTFEKIIKACKVLKKNDVPFLLCSTPNVKNLEDLTKIYSLSYNLGARAFFLNEPIFINQYGKDISDFFIKNIDLFNKADENLTKQSVLVSSWRNNQLKGHDSNEIGTVYFKDTQKCFNNPLRLDKKESCGVCLSEISIDVEGSVYPCHNLHFNKFKIGDMDNYLEIKNKYIKSELITSEECSNCFYWIFCLGGCKARTLFYKDDISSKSLDCDKLKQEYFNFLTSPLQSKSEEFE